MRRLLLLLIALFAGVIALASWRPGAHPLLPTAIPMATLLPDDFTILPTFVPGYPCELQNVDVYDDKLCRDENVKERVLAQGDGVAFIEQDYHMGEGCFGSVNKDIQELHVCSHNNGAITPLSSALTSDLFPSPDGEWFAFGTMNRFISPAEGGWRPHVYRVRIDGSGLQKLDSQPFPDFAVGAPRDLRWLDDDWLAFALWDGTGEDGWHPYRLKADGSGVYEALAT